jgi:predicted nucleic acid-binding protein
MSGLRRKPLFVDTGAFYANFVENSSRHERARTVMEMIQRGELRYQPIYTTGHVLGELATLTLRKEGHAKALDTVQRIRESDAVRVVHPDEETFDTVCTEFARFDDQQISFVDHVTSVLATEYGVDHVFAFDSDFRTLGFTLVPEDVATHPK